MKIPIKMLQNDFNLPSLGFGTWGVGGNFERIQKGQLAKTNSFIEPLCKRYDKSPAQIALNWLISQKNVVAITKISNPYHLQENLDAIGWNMNKNDILTLTLKYPNQQKKSASFSGIRSIIKRMFKKVI